jgi:hypothetical protein
MFTNNGVSNLLTDGMQQYAQYTHAKRIASSFAVIANGVYKLQLIIWWL